MDQSISLVTPSMNRQRGADAFYRGISIDDHHMNPGVPAIADWQAGWLSAQAIDRARELVKLLDKVPSP